MRTPSLVNPYNPEPERLLPMKCAIFFVECLVGLPTGNYALYTASNGRKVWTRNYGYDINDEVWVYYREGSLGPEQIIVNGKEIVITE